MAKKKTKKKITKVIKNDDKDFLYENAPLVEVIFEVFWKIHKIEALDGAFIDPKYADLTKSFSNEISKKGYTYIEHLVPSEIPIEYLGKTPHIRFRQEKDKWPLYQIGPGIFTANNTPPYKGWNEMRKNIFDGLDVLYHSYPLANDLLLPEKISLRYIDGFTASHGMKNINDFISNYINIDLNIGNELVDNFIDDSNKIMPHAEFRFPIKNTQKNLLLKLAPGKSKNENALILEMNISSTMDESSNINKAKIKKWADDSHEILRTFFQQLLSYELKEKLGPKKYIKGIDK